LRQEQQSKLYQGRLELRINSDSVAYQKLHLYCERSISGMQHQKSQLEFSLRHATETCQALSQSLHLERDKVRELESRLNEVYPNIHSWLHRLDQEKQRSGCADDTMERLLLENQRQRDLINCLQSMLHAREQTVQDLQSTLDHLSQRLPQENAGQGGLFRSSVCSSEESNVEIITDTPSTKS
jgi:predicted  nucleic acid-binding Zn-ribbon protein